MVLQQAAATQGEAATRLEALANVHAELQQMEPRAQIFVKRAQEKDDDKKVYGPKMVAKVLDFWARFEAAAAQVDELGASLAPLKAQLEAERREAEQRAGEERRRREEEEARAAAAEAAQRAEAAAHEAEEARQREAEEARRQELAARERESERRGQAPLPLVGDGSA